MEQLLAIVLSANMAWNAALNSGDVKQLASLYAEDATLSPGDGKTLKGRSAIEGLFKGFVEAGVHDHTLETVEVGGTGNTIYQVAKWSAKGATANGVTPMFGGITMNVLEKDVSGKWQTRAHVWNAGQ
ncbi:MAG TPA: SgcJ/EcaC family oxidoreductase [Methylophilus sp.]|nr:SgcJ/EcaC family oxidoreductase [Methylophilus sp.]HQQ32670.1 SgcJ/EcaC family oxidoreductase [Methylophilus sp.]